jgi:hypothetical protein
MSKLTLLVALFFLAPSYGADTCSRVATINYQEVLVDLSTKNRGEGLRYYLEKDQISEDLLDEYQKNNRPTWRSAALSTLGTAMVLGGLLRTSDGEQDTITSRNLLLFGGATMIAVSYLIYKTNQYNNEYLLLKSVEEYNKRNTPKIFLAPTDPKSGIGGGIGIGQEF